MLTNQELSGGGLNLPWHAFTECLLFINVPIPCSLGESHIYFETQNKTVVKTEETVVKMKNWFRHKISETRIVDVYS